MSSTSGFFFFLDLYSEVGGLSAEYSFLIVLMRKQPQDCKTRERERERLMNSTVIKTAGCIVDKDDDLSLKCHWGLATKLKQLLRVRIENLEAVQL